MDIYNYIKNSNNKRELNKFIKTNLNSLKNTESMEIGHCTENTVYSGFLDKRIRANVSLHLRVSNGEILETYLGSVKFDDDNMFKHLVFAIRETTNMYDAVYLATKNYLRIEEREKLKDAVEKRHFVYRNLSMPKDKTLCIKLFSKKKIAQCSEVAGVVQNMFKFLGIESDYVISGFSDGELHSFNIVYPEGKEKTAILFDGNIYSTNHPVMYYLDNSKRKNIFNNKNIILSEKDISKAYNKLLNVTAIAPHSKDDYSILKDSYPETLMKLVNPEKTKKLKLEKGE